MGGVWGGRRLAPGVHLSLEWGGGQDLWEVSPEFQEVGVGGKGVVSGPYLPRSAAHPGGSGWQTRTQWWPGGHVAPSGPTWLQMRRRLRSEVRPQQSQRDPSSCRSRARVRSEWGAGSTPPKIVPSLGGGARSARDGCVTRAAWTPVPSLAHSSAVTSPAPSLPPPPGQLGVLAAERAGQGRLVRRSGKGLAETLAKKGVHFHTLLLLLTCRQQAPYSIKLPWI